MEIDKLIGNTPMVKIKIKYGEKIINVYAKLEYYNYTGSIKDRLAYYIIKQAKNEGTLQEGMPIIEATSGNTGISFASLGAFYKHPVHIFMPDWVSKERILIMELYGAKVHLVSKEDGGFKEAIKRADKLALEINGFRPNQFDNEKNVLTHYLTTGLEIVNKIDEIDGFVSGVGTGGTLMGIAKRIKKSNPKARIVALEPAQLPLISKGVTSGKHRIEGIGDDFIPSIFDENIVDDVITVDDEDAINMARRLALELGLGVGISSGANLLGAIKMANDNENIVTVFADDFKKYLTTDLSKQKNNDKTLISNNIEFLEFNNV